MKHSTQKNKKLKYPLIYYIIECLFNMAILRSKEIRKLEDKETDKRLNELRLELAKERGNIRIGGTVTSTGRIREIRRTVARILTIRKEKELGLVKQKTAVHKTEVKTNK